MGCLNFPDLLVPRAMGTLPLQRDRPLVSSPPNRGELQEQLKSLAAKKWHHPISGQRVQFGLSTVERWFYRARNEKKDPVRALRRKIRSDQGGHPALCPELRKVLAGQYRQHPNWSYQLHAGQPGSAN